MDKSFLLYGSNGFTGNLIAREAVKRGMQPILAGRNREQIAKHADELGLRSRVFSLDDARAVKQALQDVPVVLQCAGPFSITAKPMVDACLKTKTHYLDITGEIAVFESLARKDAAAKSAGVMLLPGVGFDIVPSDCLAAHLKSRLPFATHLALAFSILGAISRGTALTALGNIHRGGAIRRDGKIVRVPAAWKSRQVDFGNGMVDAVTIPWGDVSTAFYSTAIPNIEVYGHFPAPLARLMIASRYLGWLLGSPPAQNFLKRLIQAQPPGPSDESRTRGKSLLWGEARDDVGHRVVSRMKTPEGYTLTALTALAVVKQVLAGNTPIGFQTPSRAYGKDFILEIDGVERRDD